MPDSDTKNTSSKVGCGEDHRKDAGACTSENIENIENINSSTNEIMINKDENNDSVEGATERVAEASDTPLSTSADPTSPPSVASDDSSSSSYSPAKLCLAPCHRFHTNPAMSSPKHFLHIHNKASSASSNNNSSSVFNYNSNYNSNIHSSDIQSTKALKRKQRLAQYKAQTSYSTMDHHQTSSANHNDNTSSNNTHNQPNFINTTGGIAVGGTAQPNQEASSASQFNVGVSGDACHVKWAPNLNYIKNIELVAIASPLSPIESHHLHHQQLAGHGPLHNNNSRQNQLNNNNNNSLLPNTITQNHGSSVFVLVFDEGIFSHNGDFSLTSELCDLFGLPTESLVVKDDDNHKMKQNYKNDFDKTEKKKKQFGLRRRVFQSKSLLASCTNDEKNEKTKSSSSSDDVEVKASGASEEKERDMKMPSSLQKIESTYHKVMDQVVKPLVSHVSCEVENCAQILRNEVMGDGRIHSSPMEVFTTSKKKEKLSSNEFMSSSLLSKNDKKGSDPSTISDIGQDRIEVDGIEVHEIDNDDVHIECIQAEVGGTAECPIKPTLVFRINLPYSNTSMEVMNIEWNSDGTSLTIVQRRKGFSTSSGTSLGTGITNKKKKANSISNLPISPGNTAVSFWCIPPWLHVDYDDMKVSYDNDDEEFSEEKLIIKANNTCFDCGWEVEDDNDNRSLFPLWEWYLAKYVFKDEFLPKDIRRLRKTKIMMKNVMEQQAYMMELSAPSTTTNSTVSRHGKKSTTRGGRGSISSTDNVNSMMNGDVTCLFWENATPEDEKVLGANAYKERKGHEKDYLHFADEEDDANKDSTNNDDLANGSEKKPEYDSIITPSKWIAIGTSKGQIVLHNSAASFISSHTRKNKNKLSTNSPLFTSITPQSRTVAVPVRHKKRVTCGAWVDNLLVCGYVGTGCLSLVSTFPKAQQRTLSATDRNSESSRFKKEVLEPLFGEKTAKVLGNIMLPGGRDAVHIQIGNIEGCKNGSTTILSVNCEEKCLLFYTFPKLIEDADNNSQPDITSSPAMEVNFAMNARMSGTSCGNIIFHYQIPNTFLAVVAFSSGYFSLIDWVAGSILSDKDVSVMCVDKNVSDVTSLHPKDTHNDDDFLVDVAFHLPTCTAACLTNTGHVIVYHVQIRDKLPSENTTEAHFISISSKTHTRPKTKSSSSHNDLFIDRESPAMALTGTVNLLCARRIVGPKGYHVEFSSDGDTVSISLGDESVTILSIKTDAKESAEIKQKLAQRIFLFTPNQLKFLVQIAIFAVLWLLQNQCRK